MSKETIGNHMELISDTENREGSGEMRIALDQKPSELEPLLNLGAKEIEVFDRKDDQVIGVLSKKNARAMIAGLGKWKCPSCGLEPSVNETFCECGYKR